MLHESNVLYSQQFPAPLSFSRIQKKIVKKLEFGTLGPLSHIQAQHPSVYRQ